MRSMMLRLGLIMVAWISGCTGSADVHLIPLNTRSMSPDTPLEYRFAPRECYWWLDDEGLVNLAMSFRNISPLGDLTRRSLDLSLVLDEPPASTGREYKVGRHTVRGLWHDSALHLRMRSFRGIVVLDEMPRERFSGQFRVYCSSKRFEVLTGWRRQAQVLIQGTVHAVHGPESGRDILARTEEGQPRSTDDGGTN